MDLSLRKDRCESSEEKHTPVEGHRVSLSLFYHEGIYGGLYQNIRGDPLSLFLPAHRNFIFRILGNFIGGKPLSNHARENDDLFIVLKDNCIVTEFFRFLDCAFHMSLRLLHEEEAVFH